MKKLTQWMTVFALIVNLTLSMSILANTPSAQALAGTELAMKHGNTYPTVDIHSSMVGWDKGHKTVYFDATQREERRVVIQKGLVYDHAGNPVLNTTSKHRNRNNYVMDAAGNFYLFDEFTSPSIRHSSMFAGGPVAGAGNIQIKDGRIVYIDSDSGHYPTKSVFKNVLKELASCGVDVAALAKS